MREWIIAILKKWACQHQWEEIFRNSVYEGLSRDDVKDKLPIATEFLFKCTQCGKFKEIYL